MTTVVTTSASEPTHEVNQSSTQEKGCGALRAGSAHTDCDRTKVHGDKMETTLRIDTSGQLPYQKKGDFSWSK